MNASNIKEDLPSFQLAKEDYLMDKFEVHIMPIQLEKMHMHFQLVFTLSYFF